MCSSDLVRGIVAGAGISAVRHDFAASLVRTLWFQVGVFALAFLMMLAWPRGVGRKVTAPGDAGSAAGARSPEVAAGAHGAEVAAGAQGAAVAAGQAALHAAGAGPGGSAAVAAGPGVSAAASNGQVA